MLKFFQYNKATLNIFIIKKIYLNFNIITIKNQSINYNNNQ